MPSEKPTALLYRAALGPGFVLMLGLIPFTGFAAFLAVYGPDIGLDETAPVFFAYAGMVLAIRIFGAKLPDRLGWRRASTIALTAVGVGAPRAGGVGLGRGGVDRGRRASALGMSLLYPALFSAALDDVPDHERSQAVGTFSLFFDLSQGLGAPLLGVVVALVRRARRVPRGRAHRRRRLLGPAPPPPRPRARRRSPRREPMPAPDIASLSPGRCR